MKKIITFMLVCIATGQLFSQQVDSTWTFNGNNGYLNSASRLLNTNGNLVIGGYAEAHYNQDIDKTKRYNGKLDVHRVVMLLGYNFSSKTQFISEIEYEHVKEVYVEQAFIQHKLNPYINFRGGLMLIPMGIVNEYHEPTTFNGVERPIIDNKIAPTTWREMGMGFAGALPSLNLKYQAYLVNGFNGYDGKQILNGSDGLRKGRQLGAESYISAPNYTGKVEYYGIRGLNLGLSGYYGNSQSKAYNGIVKGDSSSIKSADSTSVGIAMVGVDARYRLKGLQVRGQFYYTSLSNTEQYNNYKGKSDLGSAMYGYYVEVGYNVFQGDRSIKTELIPFVRYEQYDTQYKMIDGLTKKPTNAKGIITTGLSYKLTSGSVLKVDYQFALAGDGTYTRTINAGFGVTF